MSDDPSSSTPQEEAAQKKPSSKPAKKKSAKKAANTEKADKATKAGKTDQGDKAGKASEKKADDNVATEATPAVKRGVRNAKKAAGKKASAKKSTGKSDKDGTKESDNPKADNKESDDRSNDDTAARKQARRGRNRNRNRQDQGQKEEPKVKLDSKKVAKRAWKIFLGEVNEEGLVLIADKDARELARRSLRVAEIYCREEAISLQQEKKGKAKSADKEDSK